jgi:hypothetical protein
MQEHDTYAQHTACILYGRSAQKIMIRFKAKRRQPKESYIQPMQGKVHRLYGVLWPAVNRQAVCFVDTKVSALAI